jgi:hypothetical protein
MSDRGKILHPDRKQQINDFSGLVFGKITPTDLDGVIEYHNKAYVFLEVKYDNAELPYGQRLAIQRLVQDTSNKEKYSIAIIAQHSVFNTKDSVNVAECQVREIYLYTENRWRKSKRAITVRQCIDSFFRYYVDNNKEFKNTS